MFHHIKDPDTIDQLFKYKSQIFNEPFSNLSTDKLLDNLASYKRRANEARLRDIKRLKDRIEALYIDDKLKPERLELYTNELVRVFKFTSVISAFVEVVPQFMPNYNELKHFSAEKIKQGYQQWLDEEAAERKQSDTKGPYNISYNFDK
jgi:hypothetical protein